MDVNALPDLLQRNLEMVKSTLADFSDADLLVRPCPGANHTAWQLGHVIKSETSMGNGIKPGSMPALPASWETMFTKETAAKDEPSAFPKKAELLDQFAKTRAATVALVKSLKPEDMGKPGPERMQRFAPTVGHAIMMPMNHTAMHVGQIQVIRRKLGKPILF